MFADHESTTNADTIEWVIVLSGEIDYLLPDGTLHHLREKDSIVQIGEHAGPTTAGGRA